MLADRIIARSLALALAFCPALAGAQSPMVPGFPPGTFQSRAAIDAAPASGHAMITPIMLTGNGAAPSGTAANYINYSGGAWGTSTVRDSPISIAGTINGLTVRLPTAVASGQYVFTLYRNQSATGLACTVTSSGTTCTNNTSVSVVAGDTLMWQSCPGTHSGVAGSCTPGTPTVQTTGVSISAVFTSTTNGESFVTLGRAFQPSGTVTNYQFFGTPNGAWTATEANVSGIIPTGTVLDQLQVTDTTAPGAGKQVVWTVWKNGAATALTCTQAGTGSGTGITFCSDTNAGHAVTVAAGDKISIESCPGTVALGTCTPALTPNNGNTGASLRSVPTIPGEAISMNVSISALSTGSNRFLAITDPAAAATETAFALVPTIFTLQKTFFALDAAPGAGTPSRTLINRFGTGGGQSTGTISVPLTTSASGSDTTHTYSASVNDLVNWQETVANTPASNVFYKFSAVLATP